MKKIALNPRETRLFALVDDVDFDRIAKHAWSVYVAPDGRSRYATRRVGTGKQRTIYMHQEVMGTGPRELDHRDRDGLNNQRSNLRRCTSMDNARNAGKNRSGRTSVYKGVCFDKTCRHWRAYITVDYKRIGLGYYANEEDAALAYDEAARQHFGEFAKPNFPDRTPQGALKKRTPRRGYKLHLSADAMERRRAAARKARIHFPKPCESCGREFLPIRGTSKYCSRRCLWDNNGKPAKTAAPA